ncbi:MAG: PF20097 family protein [Candidatus Altiarchaeota archaeon]
MVLVIVKCPECGKDMEKGVLSSYVNGPGLSFFFLDDLLGDKPSLWWIVGDKFSGKEEFIAEPKGVFKKNVYVDGFRCKECKIVTFQYSPKK